MHRFSLRLSALLLGGAFFVTAALPLPGAETSQGVKDFTDAIKTGQEAVKNQEWVKAAKAYETMVRLAPDVNKDTWTNQKEANWWVTIGGYYRKGGQFKEGDAALRKGLDLYQKQENLERVAFVRNDLGDLNREWGRYRQAEDELKEAARICE